MARTIPQTSRDYDNTSIVERPDGFYWHEKESDKVFGPFATCSKPSRIWNITLNQIMSLEKHWSRPRRKSASRTGLIVRRASRVKNHFVLKTDHQR